MAEEVTNRRTLAVVPRVAAARLPVSHPEPDVARKPSPAPATTGHPSGRPSREAHFRESRPAICWPSTRGGSMAGSIRSVSSVTRSHCPESSSIKPDADAVDTSSDRMPVKACWTQLRSEARRNSPLRHSAPAPRSQANLYAGKDGWKVATRSFAVVAKPNRYSPRPVHRRDGRST